MTFDLNINHIIPIVGMGQWHFYNATVTFLTNVRFFFLFSSEDADLQVLMSVSVTPSWNTFWHLQESSISLHAVSFFVWAAHKIFEVLVTLHVQGVPEKTLVSVQRPITQVWKQVLGQVGAVFKSSGYQLSFEPKKSRII